MTICGVPWTKPLRAMTSPGAGCRAIQATWKTSEWMCSRARQFPEFDLFGCFPCRFHRTAGRLCFEIGHGEDTDEARGGQKRMPQEMGAKRNVRTGCKIIGAEQQSHHCRQQRHCAITGD